MAKIEGNALYFNHNDHLGTPMMMTDQNRNIVWQTEHRPFGEPQSITGTITNNLRFPGQYYDAETGLHYNYFRDYMPEIGRYIEKDPIGFEGGSINLYEYVKNDPVSNVDPEGLTTVGIGIGIGVGVGGPIGGVIGGTIGLGLGLVIGDILFSPPADRCKNDDHCKDQWIADTKWCDNRFKGRKNIACHRWAQEEYYRCLAGQPRQPFRL